MKKLKWGVLSTAKIGTQKVIPGMQKSGMLEVAAIASRDLEQAQKAAFDLGIGKAYGSYESLLADPEIDVIYNPLPNHLHVEWTAKAIAAGKHVLCEKPLLLDADDSAQLIQLRDQHGVKVGEAFMVKTHPQWILAKELADSGELGDVKHFQSTFTYFNNDPANIRNIPAYGGGALWDIGCYPVMTSRYLFGKNPTRVSCSITRDLEFGTDVFTSAIMEFAGDRKATFMVSTQLAPYQRVHLLGTKKELEIKIPFNSPTDRPTQVQLNNADILLEKTYTDALPPCDQYQLQAEAFCRAVLQNGAVPVSLEDARDHCRIIQALFQSAEIGKWITL